VNVRDPGLSAGFPSIHGGSFRLTRTLDTSSFDLSRVVFFEARASSLASRTSQLDPESEDEFDQGPSVYGSEAL